MKNTVNIRLGSLEEKHAVSPVVPECLPAESRILHYQIHEELGRGTFGTVYRATDLMLGRQVALKTLSSVDAETCAVLMDEARALASVSHPNLVTVYSVHGDAEIPCIAMELVSGTLLRNVTVNVFEALNVLEEVANALQALHTAGLEHGDIKPDNIIISEGHAKLLDLSLSSYLRKGVTDTYAGTPGYSAPEKLNQLDAVNASRSDLYSLAIVAFELLSGHRPFKADNLPEYVVEQARCVIPSMPQFKHLEDSLRMTFETALNADPSKRFESAIQFVKVLRHAFRGTLEDGRSLKLAIVEDDVDAAELLMEDLQERLPAARIQTFENGEDFVASLPSGSPDLAIFDLHLPGASGATLIQAVRACEKGPLPVVMLSASASSSDWVEAQQAGAERFFVKPVVLKELVEFISQRTGCLIERVATPLTVDFRPGGAQPTAPDPSRVTTDKDTRVPETRAEGEVQPKDSQAPLVEFRPVSAPSNTVESTVISRLPVTWRSPRAILAFILVVCTIALMYPLIPPLTVGFLLASLVGPLRTRLKGFLNREHVAAVLTSGIAVAFIIPIIAMALAIVSSARGLLEQLKSSDGLKQKLTQLISQTVPAADFKPDITNRILDNIGELSSRVFSVAGTALTSVGDGALQILLILVSTYVSLMYGKRLTAQAATYLPFSVEQIERFQRAFAKTGKSLVIGMGGTCLSQAVVATVIFAVLGIPGALALGAITFFAALVPSFGTALVWGPVAVGLLVTGQVVPGVILLVTGTVVIGGMDNFLRPILARVADESLSASAVLLTMFGALLTIGPWGLILGPIVFRLTLEALEMLREQSPSQGGSSGLGLV